MHIIPSKTCPKLRSPVRPTAAQSPVQQQRRHRAATDIFHKQNGSQEDSGPFRRSNRWQPVCNKQGDAGTRCAVPVTQHKPPSYPHTNPLATCFFRRQFSDGTDCVLKMFMAAAFFPNPFVQHASLEERWRENVEIKKRKGENGLAQQ
ncbi:NACHT, LRR and PYD domains-containing protein 3-like protein [Anopheles sinensis]|uniref:NACHT, LRR and PYD domains-containing protein 3-like protein n=1 Tax=Anopheles sinensis TaxID=74873 RepID=A0A084VFT6_ANOSI|nr:NACHT, LRR and PYD domains-containing protein 3-like protein [Anopheles sinensis]